MKSSQLEQAISFAIKNRFPLLVKGKPGIGKSDIIEAGCKDAGADLILSHPVVSDPTDFKGLPYVNKAGEAHFLPFGDLNKLIKATAPTVFFLDDLGQAPAAVQAACMQLILARRINGFKVSDNVTFLAATNRREDKAGVAGLLEPVKSRFASIVELEVDTNDWCRWALHKGNMPVELVAFIRFRPELLDNFVPSKDIVNSPSPRTVAYIGKMQNAGIPTDLQFEMFKGAAGEGFAAEYCSFLNIYKNLPNIDQIFLSPDSVPVPKEAAVLYAISGALASKITATNAENAFKYIERLPAEVGVACIKDTVTRTKDITNTKAFAVWAADKGNLIFN